MPSINAFVAPLASAAALFFGASAAWAAGAPPAGKIDLARGQQIANAVCVACHAVDGTRGVAANPILQGQHGDYLVKQLRDYKSGARENAIMKGFASTLSDDDMRHVAAFYAAKTGPKGDARNKDTVALGERIYRGGIADRQIPACAACHAPNGAGIPAQYPRLSGQHSEYTEAQLIAYRAGTRKNNAQMLGVAAKMNDREIKAVSDYIQGLR
jgi:cytochrome c553